MKLQCKICHNADNNRLYTIAETMFGTKESFDYVECAQCGCLQIKEVPGNLSDYYPDAYSSLALSPLLKKIQDRNFIIKYLKYYRAYLIIHNRSIFGKIINAICPVPDYLVWLKKCYATFESNILDAGSGAGTLLFIMYHSGFKNLTGIDLFIENDIEYPNGIKVLKRDLSNVESSYDVIMLNHSFEHMPEPLTALGQVRRLLTDHGHAMIRIPTVSSYAWKHYGTNWAQIDAPRHLFLHSLNSIERLASQAHLEIKEIIYDSTDFQFWGSEQNIRNIPLRNELSCLVNAKKSIFGQDQIKSFKKKAKQLNKEKQGDQICIFLTRG